MRKNIVLFTMALFFLGLNIHAQETYNSSGKKGEAKYAKNRTKKGFDPNRLILGGGFDAGGTSNIIRLGLSPAVGYRITNRFSAGVQLGYLYLWERDGQVAMDGITSQVIEKNVNYHIISPSVWTRFIVIENLFLTAAYEHNFFTYKKAITTNQGVGFKRDWDSGPSLLLGLGFRQPISENASFIMMGYYDVLQNIKANLRVDPQEREYSISPYAGTLGFKIGVNLGF